VDKVLVIGGAGFIGSELTNLLVEHGNDVTVVSRSAGARPSQPRLAYARGDVADPHRMRELIAGKDVVYDLSMSLGARWEDYQRDYIDGSTNVARACLEHRVRRLIYTSSISALFMGRRGKLDETAGPDSKPRKRGFYGRAKIEAERVLLGFHSRDRLPVAIFRPAIVVGPGGWLIHPALGFKVNEICILGFGPGIYPLPFVLVRDVADALLLAKDAPNIEGQSFNLAGDVRPAAVEYVRILRERTRRNIRFYPRRLWWIGLAERTRWLLKALMRKPGNICEPSRDTRSMAMCCDLDCSLAKRLLGWTPVRDREEFLRQAIDCHLKPFPPGDLRCSSR